MDIIRRAENYSAHDARITRSFVQNASRLIAPELVPERKVRTTYGRRTS